MKVYVFTRQSHEICFGHYSKKEIAEMRKDGWKSVHKATLEKWPKPNLQIRKPRNKREIGVNRHGFPIYK